MSFCKIRNNFAELQIARINYFRKTQIFGEKCEFFANNSFFAEYKLTNSQNCGCLCAWLVPSLLKVLKFGSLKTLAGNIFGEKG
jgi:hypothetical protein